MRIRSRVVGFTLIELLIVVFLIGIFAGIIISVINPAVFKGRARDGVRMQDLAVIKGGLEQYYSENNTYPGATSQLAPTY
ncbi:MAG: prepilin-type N-terminal cleavage/methylation domain-containing protein, partial [Patescibacteria group bacterium]